MTHNMTDQERFIIDILKEKKNGYYVELGAAHYSNGNNTYLLEKEYDWTGVSFEIVDSMREEFNQNRKNPCKIVVKKSELELQLEIEKVKAANLESLRRIDLDNKLAIIQEKSNKQIELIQEKANKKLEIESNKSWSEVTPSIFRSWTGKRRIDGVSYSGPHYYFLSDEVAK